MTDECGADRHAAVFVSDLHLSEERPAMVERFEALVRHCREHAAHVYVLGDLFDLWLGDDDDRVPHRRAVEALATLGPAGVGLTVVLGNHDFLLGEDFAKRTACRLVPDACTVEVHGEAVLIMHGDTLCTRDADYQAFRRYARDPANQATFLAQPMADRLAQAAGIRAKSKAEAGMKADDIMDVTPEAAVDALRSAGTRCLVHGHTHRRAVHAIEVDGEPAERIVLGDWYETDSVLWWPAGGRRFCRVADLTV